ncbi:MULTISPECIES: winged helix-turn-helix transcriptional regulator [unclassified Knoellia]|uniref:winged helix-turn-helix transcriptional regulator n=1 Tax=Knoellia altitudinis TaxID=3404795 RepID=UPI0036135469
MRGEPRSGCPINAAVEALGDPWSLIVLRDMMFGDRRYFRELLNGSDEGIASNVLSSRLKSLVAAGLLTRDGATRGQRARYSLTEDGIQTLPVLVALGSWGRAHRDTTPELTIRQQVMEEGGAAMVAELMDELRALHLGTPLAPSDGPRASERLQAAYEAVAAGRQR